MTSGSPSRHGRGIPRLMEGTALRILVAEDDRSIASVLKRRLEAAHYSVDVCYDGGAAYDYLRLTDYDVAIMDIMMPVEDGLSAVHRAREAGVRTPVLFLTPATPWPTAWRGWTRAATITSSSPSRWTRVMARVRALSRRGRSEGSAVLTLGDLSVDTAGAESQPRRQAHRPHRARIRAFGIPDAQSGRGALPRAHRAEYFQL